MRNRFKLTNNDGSYDSEVVAILKNTFSLHMGLTYDDLLTIRELIDKKLASLDKRKRKPWLKR